ICCSTRLERRDTMRAGWAMRIPKGRPRRITSEYAHLNYRARALLWAAMNRNAERAPCELAELYRRMLYRKPERFYELFEKYGDQEKRRRIVGRHRRLRG